MSQQSHQLNIVITSIVAALSIIATAWFTQDTEYENTWLYTFCVWCFVYAGYELYIGYSKRKNKDQ